MESIVEKLQKIGLAQYEAQAYLSLLNDHITTAAKLAEKSGVPRTRIYSVLETLVCKGWIKVYSGVPLLFKARHPKEIFEKVKMEYVDFLESIRTMLEKEVSEVKDKFVIKKFDLGLESQKRRDKESKDNTDSQRN